MMAFFAWSNMLLLNQANIKVSLYPHEDADLFVWGTPPIDTRFTEAIKKNNIFNHIYYIDYPAIERNEIVFNKFKIRITNWISPLKKIQKYYDATLQRLSKDTVYDKLVIAGFWNDALHLFRYFSKKNPDLKIIISEEGTINYFCGKNHKVLFNLPHQGKKQKLKNMISFYRLYKRACKRVEADCVCAPDLMHLKNNDVRTIPEIDDNNIETKRLLTSYLNLLPEELIDIYRNRSVFYYVAPFSRSYERVNKLETILETVMTAVPQEQLVIKAHNNNTSNKMNYAAQYEEEGWYIDRETYLLESLCEYINFQNKIIITRGSSSILYLKKLFNAEPYIIFTYRLCSRYHYGNDQNGDDYAANIIAMYKQPEKVFIPNSIKELQVILENLTMNLPDNDKIKEA